MIPFEPSADSRVAAKQLWDFYSALREVGFDEEQAMSIILELVASN